MRPFRAGSLLLVPNSSGHDPSRSQEPSTVMGMCEGLLTLKEAAALLRIHPKTLQNMAIRGEAPAIKLRHGWRFRESDLQRWINSLVRLPHNSSGNGGPVATMTKGRPGIPGGLERTRYGQR